MMLYTHAAAALAAAAIASTIAWNVQGWRLGSEIAGLKTQHAEAVSKSEEASRIQSEKYRAIEQELSHVQGKAETEASALRLDLDRARAAGGVSSVGLRRAAAAAATAARIDCQAESTAELRQTAANASRLLADVHNELDRRAGVYAEEADRRGIAGRACERLYTEAVKLTDGGR